MADENSTKSKNTKLPRVLIVLGIPAAVFIIVWFAFLRTYINRHFHDVEVERARITKAEKVDIGGKGIIVSFTRVGNTDFDPDVDAVSSASLMLADGKLAGNSEILSEMIANATGYDEYAIRTVGKYPSGYGATTAQARTEMTSGEELPIVDDIPDMSEYDTVIMVYPIWWGTIPEAVKTFFNHTELGGKTIYSVVTHGGSYFGSTIKDSAKYTKGTLSENNLAVFDKDVINSLPDVTGWLKTIKQ